MKNNEIRLAGDIVYDSIVDGPGLRTVIYTQGCRHACDGCHNPQTWDFKVGITRYIDDLVSEIAENILNPHVTFSGGDPFEQAAECEQLLAGLKAIGKSETWAFTGYVWEDLINTKSPAYSKEKFQFLSGLDVLVDGKFDKSKHSYNLLYKGSSNQRIIDVQQSLITGTLVLKIEQ